MRQCIYYASQKSVHASECNYPFLIRNDNTQSVMIPDNITDVTVIIMVIIRIQWYSLWRLQVLSVRFCIYCRGKI